MAYSLGSKPNVDGPDSDYPYGKIRDKTGTVNGTPLNTLVHGDFHQFFAKLLDNSGVIANGLPDNLTNTFQYFQALWQFGNLNFVKDFITPLLGTYTTNDLIVLWGCTVTANIPGTSSITEGAIYYNGRIYKVEADASISSPSNTLVFQIDSATQPNIIYLENAAIGTGIADYDDSTVKQFSNSPEAWIAPTLNTDWANAGGGGGTNPVGYYKDILKIVRLKGLVTYINAGSGTSIVLFTLPSGYRPAWPYKTAVYFSAGSGGVSSFVDSKLWTIEVATNGDVSLMSFDHSIMNTITFDLSAVQFRIA